jgi:hypothetical protein
MIKVNLDKVANGEIKTQEYSHNEWIQIQSIVELLNLRMAAHLQQAFLWELEK